MAGKSVNSNASAGPYLLWFVCMMGYLKVLCVQYNTYINLEAKGGFVFSRGKLRCERLQLCTKNSHNHTKLRGPQYAICP